MELAGYAKVEESFQPTFCDSGYFTVIDLSENVKKTFNPLFVILVSVCLVQRPGSASFNPLFVIQVPQVRYSCTTSWTAFNPLFVILGFLSVVCSCLMVCTFNPLFVIPTSPRSRSSMTLLPHLSTHFLWFLQCVARALRYYGIINFQPTFCDSLQEDTTLPRTISRLVFQPTFCDS